MTVQLTIHVFSGKRTKNLFKKSERIVVEDGITTIRPWRNGGPGGTPKEIEAAFAEFARAIRPDGNCPSGNAESQGFIEYQLDLEGAV
jgi:hypothetical protein